jgi:hypothetical protein
VNLCFDSLVLGLHYQNVVVKLADFQSNIVLDSAGPFTARLQLRTRYVVSCFDFEQFAERLGQPRATRDDIPFALADNQLSRRNDAISYDAKAACGNSDELCIGEVRKRAVIPNRWQVCASGNLFGVLLFFDMKSRDTHNVIVPERQRHGFVEIETTWDVRFWLLRQGKR